MLQRPTDPAWIKLAVQRFDEVLADHAHCEKKAAAHALSLLSTYPEVPGLARAMARLAREEAGHLAQVIALLEKRGLAVGRDLGDPYAQGLMKLLRNSRAHRLLDLLLVSALIEERSRERLELLGEHLREAELKAFYSRLAKVEKGHGSLFLRLAKAAGPGEHKTRLAELAAAEARLIATLPIRAAIH
jgi:tRNA 2-(methylsulfanyl)-N6-isopentenyladenosine37 hydroxylase